MIKLNNINKYFNRRKSNELHVINNTSLELPDTGLISFLGESGSGKSTLLNVIGGLDKASGEIIYDDLVLSKYNMQKVDKYRANNIGYVFQGYNLLNDKTVTENIKIALELINIYNKDEQNKRIEASLRAVGMFKARKKLAGSLSGGEMQRISIARALAKGAKIIIADEPTGNLDSLNAIKVMNILKAISDTTLVLLVTHNEGLAYSYSDCIYRISDGAIQGSEEGSSSNMMLKDDNTIYLKDMDKRAISADHDILYYSDSNNRLSLRIVERNGIVYIDSPMNIILAKDSRVKLLDKHQDTIEEIEREEPTKIDFDSSSFNRNSSNNIFVQFIRDIRTAIAGVRVKSKKLKLLYIGLFIIGALFSLSIVLYTNFRYVNADYFNVDSNYYTIRFKPDSDYYGADTILNTLINKEAIRNLSFDERMEFTLHVRENNNIDENIESELLYYKADSDLSIAKGRSIEKPNECIITRGLADEYIKKSNFLSGYDDLFGLTIEPYYLRSGCTIVGISDSKRKLIYLDSKSFMDITDKIDDSYHDNNIIKKVRDYRYENMPAKRYIVTEGKDLDGDPNKKECLIANYQHSYAIGDKIIANFDEYTIVGYYNLLNSETAPNEVIVNDYYMQYIPKNDTLSNANSYYDIIEGRDIEASNECIASCYTSYKINDIVKGSRVVGIYNGDYYSYGQVLFSSDIVIANTKPYSSHTFKVVDMDKLLSLCGDKCEIINILDIEMENYKMMFSSLALTSFIIAIITGVIAISFIYLILRARVLNEIYEIGVFRALGAKRMRIYKENAYLTLAIMLSTIAPGYIVGIICSMLYGEVLNYDSNMTVFMNNYLLWFIGFILTILIGLIIGLIPLINILRKTPAEILTSYDN